MSYGLNLRKSEFNPTSNPSTLSSNGADPLLNKLREDLKRLPEDVGLDEFNDMPVEGFGRALMAGYGWVEGRGIGRNAKEDVKVVEYSKRTAKEGLGFTGQLPESSQRGNQDSGRKKAGGESDSERGKGGQVANNEREKGFYVGKDVRIVGGKGIGKKGRILQVKRGGEIAVLRLLTSEEEVKVDIRDLAELGSVEEERCLKELKELKVSEKSIVGGKSSSRDNRETDKETMCARRDSGGDGEMRDRMKERKRGREEIKGNQTDKLSWLTCHIRVRIISKHIKGGRLYLKKGEVVDMVGPTTCDVAIDESKELIQGVDQAHLETAIPKRGGPVLVLYGRHKGVFGRLVERDTEKEAGVVQDADTHELHNVRLEQIAEYIGDPSYIGY